MEHLIKLIMSYNNKKYFDIWKNAHSPWELDKNIIHFHVFEQNMEQKPVAD